MFEALAAWGGPRAAGAAAALAAGSAVHRPGITAMVADHFRADRSDDLPGLLEDIVFLVALVLADEATARRVARGL
jgi:hypothetical protein